MTKVCLAIIDNRRTWKDYFSVSLISLLDYTRKNGVEVELRYYVANSVETMRNYTVLDCLQGDFTHYMALDLDMEYPEDLIIRLLNHNKDIVVPRLYRRSFPYTIVQAYKYHFPFWEQSNLLKEINQGLVKVEISGPPGMLIKTKILREIYEKTGKVWFEREYELKGNAINGDFSKVSIFETGSDVLFCKKIKDIGAEIWVDTDFDIPHESGDFFVVDGKIQKKEFRK